MRTGASRRGRAIRRAPSHYDERDPRYGALLEAGLVDLGRASHTCPWSRPIKTRTVPDVPAVPKVKVVRPGSVSVTLEWREPRDNGDPITSYDVQVCDAREGRLAIAGERAGAISSAARRGRELAARRRDTVRRSRAARALARGELTADEAAHADAREEASHKIAASWRRRRAQSRPRRTAEGDRGAPPR